MVGVWFSCCRVWVSWVWWLIRLCSLYFRVMCIFAFSCMEKEIVLGVVSGTQQWQEWLLQLEHWVSLGFQFGGMDCYWALCVIFFNANDSFCRSYTLWKNSGHFSSGWWLVAWGFCCGGMGLEGFYNGNFGLGFR